jgi:hypothetical protein
MGHSESRPAFFTIARWIAVVFVSGLRSAASRVDLREDRLQVRLERVYLGRQQGTVGDAEVDEHSVAENRRRHRTRARYTAVQTYRSRNR